MAEPVEEVNELMAKKNHDYYKPRKCSVTNRLLGSKDHASVQINVGSVDKYGIYTGDYSVFCLSGALRRRGEGRCLRGWRLGGVFRPGGRALRPAPHAAGERG